MTVWFPQRAKIIRSMDGAKIPGFYHPGSPPMSKLLNSDMFFRRPMILIYDPHLGSLLGRPSYIDHRLLTHNLLASASFFFLLPVLL